MMKKHLRKVVGMPDTFAHQYFGDLVFKAMSNEYKLHIVPYIDLYNIGLQGPDFLFFYKPYKMNDVPIQGSLLHRQTGHDYWKISLNTLKSVTTDYKASLAYLSGVMCHYVLDSCCHAFVNQYEKETGVIHPDIEGEFDRYLLESLGLDPHRTDLIERFLPTRTYAEIIARFTQALSPDTTYAALKGFRFYRKVFHCPNALKRSILYKILKLAGKYDKYRGQIINVKPYDNCEESDKNLYLLLHEQVQVCVELITSLYQCAETGDSSSLINRKRLAPNFDGVIEVK